MKFYIVTPSFNSINWLPCCIRSVADQVCEGIQVHHHIQDGGSSDGSVKWLETWKQDHADTTGYTFTYESAKDAGMYDAINKAWENLPLDADVTAHLNSDEQYLPFALSDIAREFVKHPNAEVAIGTYIVVDAQGRYICHRRPIKPRRWISRTVCEIITCACFHRVSSFLRHGVRFNACWRAIADVAFYRDLVNSSPRFLILPHMYTSVFTVTGDNLQWSDTSKAEWAHLMSFEPRWVRKLHAFTYRWSNLKRILTDAICSSPDSFSIYLPSRMDRSCVHINKSTCRWSNRTQGS